MTQATRRRSADGPADTVTVVICAYTLDRLADLERSLDSVRGQSRRPDEVIVVIDHNDELLREVGRRVDDVTLMANSSTRGLSGARNTGVAAASCSIIAFLDDDATATPEWLERMLVHYCDPSVIGVGGASRAAWMHGRPGWFPAEFDWVVGCSYKGLPTAPSDVRNLIGSNMSFRRTAFATVGGFHTAIGRVPGRLVGCEETEFCIRATSRIPGSRIVYDPDVAVDHHLPAGRRHFSYFVRRCIAEGESKAIVTEISGVRAGLSTERRYTRQVLPHGVAAAVADAMRSRSVTPVLRAGAIVVGLACTIMGYVAGGSGRWWPSTRGRRAGALPSPPDIPDLKPA